MMRPHTKTATGLSGVKQTFQEDDVEEAFKAFDLDKNDFVGARELRHVLKGIGEEANDDEVDEMLNMVDKDGDGQVSYPEFLTFCKRYFLVAARPENKEPPAVHPLPGLGLQDIAPKKKKPSSGTNSNNASHNSPHAHAQSSHSIQSQHSGGSPHSKSQSFQDVDGHSQSPGMENVPLDDHLATEGGQMEHKDSALSMSSFDKNIPAKPPSKLPPLSEVIATLKGSKTVSKEEQEAAEEKERLDAGPDRSRRRLGNLSEQPIALKRAMRAGPDQHEYAQKSSKFKTVADFAKEIMGLVSFDEFCQILGIPPSQYVEQLFDMFDENRSQEINMMEFLSGLINVTELAREDKIRFAFNLFDCDKDKVLSKVEVENIFRANNFTNKKEVASKVHDVFQMFDTDEDGTLSFNEFKEMAKTFPDLLFPSVFVATSLETLKNG